MFLWCLVKLERIKADYLWRSQSQMIVVITTSHRCQEKLKVKYAVDSTLWTPPPHKTIMNPNYIQIVVERKVACGAVRSIHSSFLAVYLLNSCSIWFQETYSSSLPLGQCWATCQQICHRMCPPELNAWRSQWNSPCNRIFHYILDNLMTVSFSPLLYISYTYTC